MTMKCRNTETVVSWYLLKHKPPSLSNNRDIIAFTHTALGLTSASGATRLRFNVPFLFVHVAILLQLRILEQGEGEKKETLCFPYARRVLGLLNYTFRNKFFFLLPCHLMISRI